MKQVLNTWKFAKKVDAAVLKSDVDKLNIDHLEKVSTGLSSSKSKVDKLNVDKLVPVPVGWSKLSDVVKNDFIEKTKYNQLVKNVKAIQITDTSNVLKKTDWKKKD